MAVKEPITASLHQLHLPAFVDNYNPQAALATNDGWPYDRYLLTLCELELEERRQRKTERLLRFFEGGKAALEFDGEAAIRQRSQQEALERKIEDVFARGAGLREATNSRRHHSQNSIL